MFYLMWLSTNFFACYAKIFDFVARIVIAIECESTPKATKCKIKRFTRRIRNLDLEGGVDDKSLIGLIASQDKNGLETKNKSLFKYRFLLLDDIINRRSFYHGTIYRCCWTNST